MNENGSAGATDSPAQEQQTSSRRDNPPTLYVLSGYCHFHAYDYAGHHEFGCPFCAEADEDQKFNRSIVRAFRRRGLPLE